MRNGDINEVKKFIVLLDFVVLNRFGYVYKLKHNVVFVFFVERCDINLQVFFIFSFYDNILFIFLHQIDDAYWLKTSISGFNFLQDASLVRHKKFHVD